MTSVTVAMLTYRRNDRLRSALPAVLEQVIAGEGRTELLVVDNDPDAGARTVVEGAASPRVRYVHEPRPGIAHARNRALDEAAASQALIFIDDDELPEPGWLDALLAEWAQSGASAVVGAVVPRYEGEPDPWVVSGAFFVRPRWPTGTRVAAAATNNLLIDLSRVGALRFDERFGLTGGEDTLFTRQLRRAGGEIVFCDEAVVSDIVPEDRARREWVLRRQVRSGNSARRVELALAGSSRRRLAIRFQSVLGGALRMGAGGLRYLAGTATGSVWHEARGLRTAARGAGMVGAGLGRVTGEYGRPVA